MRAEAGTPAAATTMSAREISASMLRVPVWHIADFRVNQFVRSEVLALARHHAHQQGPRRPGQFRERRHEGELVVVQQIAMARRHPAQHFLEVVQVVKRVVQGDVGDRGTVHLASIPMDSARSNQSVPVR